MGLKASIKLPANLTKIISPKSCPLFKTKPEVVQDKLFKAMLEESIKLWLEVKSLGVPVLNWWEGMVKPGIKRIAINRSREINKESREELNLLLLRQGYLTKKIQKGNVGKLTELKSVHIMINQWYDKSCEKVKQQSRVDEITQSEKVRIYHHELHQKYIQGSSILKLQTKNTLPVQTQSFSECLDM